MRSAVRGHKPDYLLLVLACGLLAFGLIVVYAVSPGMSALGGVSETYYISKQLIAIALGTAAFITLSKLPYNTLRKFIMPLAIVAVIAALGVQVLGEEINGAHRWIQIGGISFQPAELAKFTLLIWAADLLARKKAEGKLGDTNSTLKPILIVLGAIAVIIGVLQSDFGSTTVMVSMVAAMMFISGVPFGKLARIGLVIVIGMAILILPSGYRRGRVATFLNPTADCQNTG